MKIRTIIFALIVLLFAQFTIAQTRQLTVAETPSFLAFLFSSDMNQIYGCEIQDYVDSQGGGCWSYDLASLELHRMDVDMVINSYSQLVPQSPWIRVEQDLIRNISYENEIYTIALVHVNGRYIGYVSHLP